MNIRYILTAVASLAVVGAVAGLLSYGGWRGWPFPDKPAQPAAEENHHHGSPDRVTLSPQARANLKLITKPLQPETYSRIVVVPGMVVERPGQSDRSVAAPIAGVVRRIAAVPGDMVGPGDELFTLRLNSEYLQNSQTELYKTTRELQINEEQKERLEKVSEAVPKQRLVDLEFQERRLSATLQALRYDLAARGLNPDQIRGAAEGRFVTEITIRVPGIPGKEGAGSAGANPGKPEPAQPMAAIQPVYEVEELKVQLGDQVQAGQALATLANHQALFLEGRVFPHEAPLFELAAQKDWPVRAEFAVEVNHHWAPLTEPVRIRFLANRVDPNSQTLPVYAPLVNQHLEYTEDGQTYRIWRYRPGQRVRLYVPVEQFPDVFVLPTEAVAREGPDAYVFRANGDVFDRKSVQVLYEDRQNVVLANDGSISAGNYVAFNGAAQLNRVLKAKSAGGEGGHGHEGHIH